MYIPELCNSGRDDSLLYLNISGHRYCMTKLKANTLENSLFQELSNLCGNFKNIPFPSGLHYHELYNEYFVERSPVMFEIILQYAYTGHLNRPPYICPQALKDELTFWRLDNMNSTVSCCNIITPMANGNINNEVKQKETFDVVTVQNKSMTRRRLDKVWQFCENPESSRMALIFNLICILSIVVSIANLVIGTIPNFQHCEEAQLFIPPSFFSTARPLGIQRQTNQSNHTGQEVMNSDPNDQAWTAAPTVATTKHPRKNDKFSNSCDGGLIFDAIELACIVWFTIELILRFISCPDRWAFVQSPLNIIDFLATFPFYIEIAIWATGLMTDLNRISGVSSVLLMLRVMRVMRAFRVLRLARYFDSLQMMGETLWESRRDMGLLVLFLAVGVLIFSTILFYIEREVEGTAFSSIPAAFWWAIVTLTTTGYGDVTPQTTMGKIMAAVACIAGVLIVAFPVSILVEHFRLSYAIRRSNVVMGEALLGQARGNGPSVVDILKSPAILRREKVMNNTADEVLLTDLQPFDQKFAI